MYRHLFSPTYWWLTKPLPIFRYDWVQVLKISLPPCWLRRLEIILVSKWWSKPTPMWLLAERRDILRPNN